MRFATKLLPALKHTLKEVGLKVTNPAGRTRKFSAILKIQIKHFGHTRSARSPRDCPVRSLSVGLNRAPYRARLRPSTMFRLVKMVDSPLGGIRGNGACNLEATNVGVVGFFGSDRDIKEGDTVKDGEPAPIVIGACVVPRTARPRR